MGTADDVEPLLDIVLVLELGRGAGAGGFEEGVQVELVELALVGDRDQLVGHLVRKETHLGERPVGVPVVRVGVGELGLGSLFVGVGPVEDLLLDELARRQGFEGGAGEVQVGAGGDGEEVRLSAGEFVESLSELVEHGRVFGRDFLLGRVVVLPLEQLLGVLPPGAEVVFVEDDEVPVDPVQPFVLGFDAPALPAQQVLERAEVDKWSLLVGCHRVAARCLGQVLPSVEVDMGGQVGLPRVLDGGLEGHD